LSMRTFELAWLNEAASEFACCKEARQGNHLLAALRAPPIAFSAAPSLLTD
jgi:hypothetical protein